jgi:hypothetical protein
MEKNDTDMWLEVQILFNRNLCLKTNIHYYISENKKYLF